MLLGKHFGELNDVQEDYLSDAHNSSIRLLAMINNVLDLAKIEASKMELDRKPVQVSDVVDEVLATTDALTKTKPVEIVTAIEENLPEVYADGLRFKQVNSLQSYVGFTCGCG